MVELAYPACEYYPAGVRILYMSNSSPVEFVSVLEPPENRINAVRFSPDLRTLYAYTRATKGASESESVEVLINGMPYEVTNRSLISIGEDQLLSCFQVALNGKIKQGDRVFVVVCKRNEERSIAFERAVPKFFSMESQYDVMLRPTTILETSDAFHVRMYNESDLRKLPVVVDEVLVSGEDFTSQCQLPTAALPADRGNFDDDERIIVIPKSISSKRPLELTVGYHLNSRSAGDGPKRQIEKKSCSFALVEGVPWPIGKKNSSYLDNWICLHSGGLREPIDDTQLQAREDMCRSSCPNIPLYWRASDNRNPDELPKLGRWCDLQIVSAQLGPVPDQLKAFRDYLRASSDQGAKAYMASIVAAPITNRRRTAAEVAWMALESLSEGSRGIRIHIDGCIDRDHAMGILKGLERSNPVLCTSYPTTTVCKVSQHGIKAKLHMLGPDSAIVYVVNDWGWRAFAQEPNSFYTVPRSEVEISIDMGTTWTVGQAFDLMSWQPLDSYIDPNNEFSLVLPGFSVGRAVLLTRKRDRSFAELLSVFRLLDQQANTKPVVTFVSEPSLDLGNRTSGEQVDVEVRLKNTSDQPISISASARQFQHSLAATISSPVLVVAPGEESNLPISVRLPDTRGRCTTIVELASNGGRSEHLDVLITAQLEHPVRANLSSLDFGTFELSGIVPERRLSFIARSGRPGRIESVTNNTDVEFAISPDSSYLTVQPSTAEHGAIHGKLDVRVRVPDAENAIDMSIPYVGHGLSSVMAYPSKLVFTDSGERSLQERVINLRCSDEMGFVINRVYSNDDAIIAIELPDGTPSEANIKVDYISGKRSPDNRNILVEYAINGGDEASVIIPIVIVRSQTGLGIGKVEQVESDEGDTSISPDTGQIRERVNALLIKARDGNDGLSFPIWAKYHRLLICGDAGYASNSSSQAASILLADSILKSDRGREYSFVVRHGKPYPRKSGPIFSKEHHRDQFLYVLALVGIPLESAITVDGIDYSVGDLLENSLTESNTYGELAWSIAAYARYVDPGQVWTNKYGQQLSLGILVKELMHRNEGACAGSHQMFALASVLSRPKHLKDSTIKSLWPALESRVENMASELRMTQSSNGAFAIGGWDLKSLGGSLEKSKAESDLFLVYSQGHILEWLTESRTAEQLSEPWILRNVVLLLELLDKPYWDDLVNRQYVDSHDASWFAVGYYYHALCALNRWLEKQSEQDDRN